jgi:hypothetical protein
MVKGKMGRPPATNRETEVEGVRLQLRISKALDAEIRAAAARLYAGNYSEMVRVAMVKFLAENKEMTDDQPSTAIPAATG